MPFVAILGAGDLGGALTYTLASRARFDEVRLIDPQGTVAVGKALDIRQAGPADGYSTRVSGHADPAAAAGAWVLVLADPLPGAEPCKLDELLKKVAPLVPGAVVVCAGATHATLLPRLVGAGICAPDLLIGSAPAAAASAAQSLVAVACRTSPMDVTATLAASATEPAPVIDWSRTSVRGRAAETVLPREQRDRVSAQLEAAWPPGPQTLAAAAARCAEDAWFGSRRARPAWVVDKSLHAPRDSSSATAPADDSSLALTDVLFAPGGRLMRPEGGA